MLTLIGTNRSRSVRVRWMLEELGLPYDHRPDPPHSDEVLRLSPAAGRIPILIDGDHVLTDSTAIMTWLADREGRLTHPPGTYQRARQDAATMFVMTELDAILWTQAKHTFVLPEKLRVPAIFGTLEKEWTRTSGQLAGMLGDGPWLAGDAFTLADIAAAHCAMWAVNVCKWPLDPALADHHARATARPAFARAMA